MKTAYEMRSTDWSSDVCSSDLIGLFGRRYARLRGARGNALVHLGFVVEVGVHCELDRPAERDDFQEIDDVAFGPDIFLGNHPRLERRVFQLRELLLPRKVDDLVPRRLEAERMHRPLPRHDDAVAAKRELRDNIRTARILAPHFDDLLRSEEHTSELQSLMRNSYDVFCLKKKKSTTHSHVLL